MALQQKNVGILAMEIYFPPTCVQQEALEAHDGASKGKYTIGLGQDCMAFCTESEDVISMSLTAVTSLFEKYGIDPTQIGRLEVGSETVIDKSKSIKTFLMQIFEKYGNTDIEGVDSTNACYGGTAALFNCVNWVESSSWDGRYGLVVCTDSAVLQVNKLVQKSFARLYFNDFLRNASSVEEVAKEKLAPFSSLSCDESYQSRDLEKASQQVAKNLYDAKVQPTTLLPKQVGNMYTASLYAAFASLVHNKHSTLDGNRVVMFSYGSGLTSTMFSFRLHSGEHPFSLSNIAAVMNIPAKLKSRHEFSPEKFVETLKLMEHRYGGKDFVTAKDRSLLSPGTYYLIEVDKLYRRFYAKKVGDDNTTDESGGTCCNDSVANGY
uniref:HMG-CoA synthase n=1 Tax=Nelumbo nucifera TaxID=4432 RepID=A0A822ZWY4_NELNU|nr:TPA_asm: hypothetical protein HUJ06_017988 [Nelumbo nucifera]